ncbi:hypothetical protein DLR58_17580 [Vibrio tarriae]|nr:hypothetical protein DLR58_17580 [Vibrio tarriae]
MTQLSILVKVTIITYIDCKPNMIIYNDLINSNYLYISKEVPNSNKNVGAFVTLNTFILF